MALMVNVACDAEECDAYEEEPAGIEDGVNVIEVATDGWIFADGEAFCPDHAHLADT